MWVDILSAITVVLFGIIGWRRGYWVQFVRLLLLAGAFAIAIGAARTSVGMWLRIFPWTPAHAHAWSFVVFLLFFGLVSRFVLEPFLLSINQDRHAPGGVSSILGLVLGGARGVLIAYVFISTLIIMGRYHGAKNPSLAIQYQEGNVGRFLLVNNFIDSEPFPHERLFRDLMGVDEGRELTDLQFDLLDYVQAHPLTQRLFEKPELLKAGMDGNWAPAIADGRILDLLTDSAFLEAAWLYEGGTFDLPLRM